MAHSPQNVGDKSFIKQLKGYSPGCIDLDLGNIVATKAAAELLTLLVVIRARLAAVATIPADAMRSWIDVPDVIYRGVISTAPILAAIDELAALITTTRPTAPISCRLQVTCFACARIAIRDFFTP